MTSNCVDGRSFSPEIFDPATEKLALLRSLMEVKKTAGHPQWSSWVKDSLQQISRGSGGLFEVGGRGPRLWRHGGDELRTLQCSQ
uniref:Uncharacterized protein n=1 Tax=Ascaris lumbricoides TaxID=6252 RepID=A0A0M3I7K6_ASCLU